ncbi:MAG: hypothetical protein FWE06_04440 [Oscillospiraceae bacterium]|nr:hypothetical protein [Oscillospiraceae bacterium]
MQSIYLAVSPADTVAAAALGLPLAHMAYAVGTGLTLRRGAIGTAMRGGLMVIHDRHYDRTGGDVETLRAEIVRECGMHQFSGVICDFEQPVRRSLEQLVLELSDTLPRKGLSLTVTERYAHIGQATLLVNSAVTTGTLRKQWESKAERYNRQLAIEIDPLRRDFILSQSGEQGKALDVSVLQVLLAERNPSVFFSAELCAYYFTYKDEMKQTHFVLFDDAASLGRKISLGLRMKAAPILLLYPDVKFILPEILANVER